MIREFKGKRPRITDTAFVSEAAYIVGDVEIGENSSVWPGAVVRGDIANIKIGDNTQIEDNCLIHTGTDMTIGNNVHIGHGAIVHCSKIGNNVLIGSHATILDGADIGECSLVGANALVPEKMSIPPRSFVVGTPAKIKGEISQAQIERIKTGVRYYVDLAREYKEHGL